MNALPDKDACAPHGYTQAPPERNRILLVEDDAAVRRYLEVTLQRAGYHTTAVADGLQALRQFLTERFDLVITDAMLPYVSGREICRFLRSHPHLARTPIVLLSGFSGAMRDDAATEADVYMAKPVRPEELIACIAHLIEMQN